MRRLIVLPMLLSLSLTIVLFAAAQEDPPPDEPTPVVPVVPDEPVESSENPPENQNFFMNLNGPLIINADNGSDFCASATIIDVSQGGTQLDVAQFTQDADDPDLGCMWGSPSSLKGYRTVWYKFTPEFNGLMTLSTLPASTQATNSYDTVLAVHTGLCGSLAMLACNDDTIGFSSTLTMNVSRNTTYYIEVADWQAGGNAIKTLDISLQMEPFTSLWKNVTTNPSQMPALTTRHASLVIGSDIYLIGGRGAGGALLNNFQKLNTNTGTWQSLLPVSGGGFLNTTAVYLPPGGGLNGRIYVPGGSIQASDQAYSRVHKYFDFGTGTWNTLSDVGGSHVTEAFAYAAAAPNNAKNGYFVTGGVVGPGYPLTTTSTVTNQVLFYQPSSDNWFLREEMLSPRYGHVAANVGGKLCVAGGLNIDNGLTVLIPNGECASGVSPTVWSATGFMQVPRYFAHSSVSPDGKWYVYGGIDANGDAVPEVEYYDPATNSWSVLGLLNDLGGQSNKPAIVWPGGGFVGNNLWAAGGSYDPTGNNLNPIVSKLQILGGQTFLPLILNTQFGSNHSFGDAWPMGLNSSISQNFGGTRELVNVYSLNLNQLRTVQVALTGVASQANVNLYLYGNNKDLIQSNVQPFPGINKTITVPLNPGRYYVIVRYKSSANFPNDLSDHYQLRISG